MYKNCYVTRGREWNHYNIHLWTDEGYSVEEFQNYGYQECPEHKATHRGLKNEPLILMFISEFSLLWKLIKKIM